MKIFGTIYPFVETNDQSYKLGRYVANYEFLIALLKYSDFDEYHIFCMSVSHQRTTQKKLLESTVSNDKKSKIKLFLYTNLKKNISETEYSVFHLGGWGYFFDGLAYLRNNYAKNKFPITGIIHSLNGLETNYHALKISVAPLCKYDTVICTSTAGRTAFEKILANTKREFGFEFSGQTDTIPLGIKDEFFTSGDKTNARAKLLIPQDSVVLLTVGRVSPQTKYDPYPLIAIFSELKRKYNNILLVVAGSANSSEITLLDNIINDFNLKNSVLPVLNFTDKTKELLFEASDIFVSLSDNIQETFGIAVIEAMAKKLPSVVSDFDGYKDLIDEGHSGFKIDTTWTNKHSMEELSNIMNFDTMQLLLAQSLAVNTDKLYCKLEELIKSKQLRNEMGKNAHENAHKKFAWSQVIKDYCNLWNNLYEVSSHKQNMFTYKNSPFKNNYLDIFSHYPTNTLNNNSLILITEHGRKILKGEKKLPLSYSDVATVTNYAIIKKVLNAVTQNPCSFYDILILLGKADNIEFTILWMAKYGLVTIEGNDD